MAEMMTEDQLALLRKIDTPTVCNILELIDPAYKHSGFTIESLVCAFPEMPPMVGYARTATVRATAPPRRSGEESRNLRLSYFDYLGDSDVPKISVVQDLDDGQAGFGAFWGEVNSNVHRALGCLGTVTNGSIRDLDMIAENFQLVAGSIRPSHAHVHMVEYGVGVSVAGMIVHHDDIVHADRHGAVVVPRSALPGLAAALDKMTRREDVILTAAKRKGVTVADMKQAIIDADKVT